MHEPKNHKAVFFDRDGTINIEKKYLSRPEDFEFIPGIFDLISAYQEEGYLIFIVTNQSGIARGYYSEADFQRLNYWLIDKFKEKNIIITKIYHCPHHPEITGNCNCRKPKPGMVFRALEEFGIDPAASILIGDKKSDILAGENAGIGRNIYIRQILGKGK